jgi:hypothetical protein
VNNTCGKTTSPQQGCATIASMKSVLRSRRSVRRLPPILGFVAIAIALGAGVAQGERIKSGNLIVSLSGEIVPHALPRTTAVPVRMHIEGDVQTLSSGQPPPLRRLTVAVNRQGKLFTRGLPICTPEQLQGTSTAGALSVCGPALVGRGQFDATVALPTLAPFPAHGAVLAFNGRRAGRQAIFLHIYSTRPTPITFVLPLTIDHQHGGEFGIVVSATMPRLAGDLAYVTGIEFTLHRRYRFAGRMHSYLSASCSAPAGFPGAIFVLAKGTFQFANGQRLRTSLVRDCQVRNSPAQKRSG